MNTTLRLLPGIVAAIAVVAAAHCAADDKPEQQVRPAHCAGSWYPREPEVLGAQLDQLLQTATAPDLPGKPIAVISPHAGYRYSAPVAAAAYRGLRDNAYKRVIVLALSHRAARTYDGVDVPAKLVAYETPLGQVPIDREACDALLKTPLFESHPGIDRGEHSLELQLPFLQQVLGDFRLVPLLVGRMSDRQHAEAAAALLPWVDGDTLLVASSDFTHFGKNFSYRPFSENVAQKLTELGDQAAAPILQCDYDGFSGHLSDTKDTICGREPIKLLLRILSMQGGAEGVRAAFDMSGNMTHDWNSSVTYQSFVFTRKPGTLPQDARKTLLQLARDTVMAFLNGQDVPKPEPESLLPVLRKKGACFVTLENKGELRGCIGNMVANGPLYKAVIRNAASACQDHRFVHKPVTAEELAEIHIEISYLTPMKHVANPDEFIVGRHGLMIALGTARGVLLPQVAYERGWTREEFLAQTCRKAGLPPDAWRQPKAKIYSFEAEVFGE